MINQDLLVKARRKALKRAKKNTNGDTFIKFQLSQFTKEQMDTILSNTTLDTPEEVFKKVIERYPLNNKHLSLSYMINTMKYEIKPKAQKKQHEQLIHNTTIADLITYDVDLLVDDTLTKQQVNDKLKHYYDPVLSSQITGKSADVLDKYAILRKKRVEKEKEEKPPTRAYTPEELRKVQSVFAKLLL